MYINIPAPSSLLYQVYTVDISNASAVREAVYKVMTNRSLSPFIPFEFTQQGMMERVGMYIVHQNFCDGEDLARGKPGESRPSFRQPFTVDRQCRVFCVSLQPHPVVCTLTTPPERRWTASSLRTAASGLHRTRATGGWWTSEVTCS